MGAMLAVDPGRSDGRAPGRRGKALRLMSPAVRQIYKRFFTGGLVLAAMMGTFLDYFIGVMHALMPLK